MAGYPFARSTFIFSIRSHHVTPFSTAENPAVTIKFDSDAKSASKERAKAYADAAKGGYIVGVSHISFPGLGRVRANAGGKGYSWIPVNYSSLK